MHRMTQGMMTCANCHGPDGRGGAVQMMMGTFIAPDIRYKTLTSEEEHDQGQEEHPPYTEDTLKRAITQGVDPAGELLAWPMPRWDISERDLNDLIDFLKTLE
jgi:mono/diheme cytochrome c family protein